MLCPSSMHNPESCVTLLLPKEPVNRKDLIVSQSSQHQAWAPRMALWEPPPITQTDGHGPKVQGPSCLTLVKCSRLGQEQNSSCICLTVVCLRGSAADKWHKLPCKTPFDLGCSDPVNSLVTLASVSFPRAWLCTFRPSKRSLQTAVTTVRPRCLPLFQPHDTLFCAVPFLQSCVPSSNGTQGLSLKNWPLSTMLLADDVSPG